MGLNPLEPGSARTGKLAVWLCYGVEPNRIVAEVPHGYRFPFALVVPVDLETPDGNVNLERARHGLPCSLEVFIRDDELTALQGRSSRVFYTFDRMTRRALTPQERAALH